MTKKRRALTPAEIDELREGSSTGTERPLVRRILSKLRITRHAGEQRTSAPALRPTAPAAPPGDRADVPEKPAEPEADQIVETVAEQSAPPPPPGPPLEPSGSGGRSAAGARSRAAPPEGRRVAAGQKPRQPSAAPSPAPKRRMPKRAITTPDEVRARYSLPPAAKPTE